MQPYSLTVDRFLDHAAKWFGDREIRRIELQVVSDNPRALRFYERLGWKRELVQLTYQVRRA